MKSKRKKWMPFAAMALLAALAIPVQLAAQNGQQRPHQPHHYQLVDMGTFGGPQSFYANTNLPRGSDLNHHGVVTGFADTSTPDPSPIFLFQDGFVSHAFQWQNGVRTDLGVLPNGWSSAPVGISANGLIAGFAQNGEIDPNTPVGFPPGFPELRAVLWENGVITDLGVLPEGGYESVSNDLNSRGQVVGAALNTIPDPNSMVLTAFNFVAPFSVQTRAFLWDEENGMQDLGTLGGTDATANLINERGQVVGWSYTSLTQAGACFPLALGSFIWERGKGMRDLGGFGGTCTEAVDLNNRGQVVGSSLLAGDQFQHAFFWEHGSIHDLGGSLGGDNTGAFAVNAAGESVGFGNLAGEALFHATLWKKVGHITDLGVIGSDTCSFASSINEKGQVVGDSKPGCGPDSDRSFLWEDGAIYDLNSLIPAGSPLYLQFTDNINDLGEITGDGSDTSGNNHAFLLIPCDEGHPGVEGCDYSLVDTAAAARVNPPPALQERSSRTPMLNVTRNRMLRPFGKSPMLGQRLSGMGQAPVQ